MPIYEYRCDDCKESFELLTTFSNREAEHACPTCESRRTRVKVSSFAFAGQSGASDLSAGDFEPKAAGGCCGGSCGCSH